MNYEDIKRLNKKNKWEVVKEIGGSILAMIAVGAFVYLLILIAGAEYAGLHQ